MQTGTKISAAAHVALLTWAFLGGVFRSDPDPFEVQDVTVISAEDYALLSGRHTAPQPAEEITQPEVAPEPETEAEAPAPVSEPEPAPAPQPEPTPAPQPEPAPAPQPDPAPAPQPAPEPAPATQPPAPSETAALVPDSPRPKPRPIDRVAPEVVAPPPPEAQPDPEVREAVTADSGAAAEQPPQQATAPEAATTEIVTEAEETQETEPETAPETAPAPQQVARAPSQSSRPSARPNRRPETPAETPAETVAAAPADPKPAAPKPAPKPAGEQPATPPANRQDDVNAALAEALGTNTNAAPTRAAPAGPPLSAGEKESLRVAVSSCWNVGSLSSAALATTVVVAVSLTPDGKPQIDTIRMVSSSGGDGGAAKQAFEAARRAIIRCGAKGYNLPTEKYDHWREIEMTFNPERMRIK